MRGNDPRSVTAQHYCYGLLGEHASRGVGAEQENTDFFLKATASTHTAHIGGRRRRPKHLSDGSLQSFTASGELRSYFRFARFAMQHHYATARGFLRGSNRLREARKWASTRVPEGVTEGVAGSTGGIEPGGLSTEKGASPTIALVIGSKFGSWATNYDYRLFAPVCRTAARERSGTAG
jgi:hypothetical protein